eukprot:9289866-Pyramimonas_sp.AAC.1
MIADVLFCHTHNQCVIGVDQLAQVQPAILMNASAAHAARRVEHHHGHHDREEKGRQRASL